jgi:hypothetical protein
MAIFNPTRYSSTSGQGPGKGTGGSDPTGIFRNNGDGRGGMGRKWFEEMNKASGHDDKDIISSTDVRKRGWFGDGPQASGYEDNQSRLIGQLQQQADGNGPSLAQAIADQQRQQGLAQMMAQQASMRGVNPALAARSNQMAAANLQANLGQQAQVGRLQEQQMAQGNLAQALAQARGQDLQFQGLDQNYNTSIGNAQTSELNQRNQLNAAYKMQAQKNRKQLHDKQTSWFMDMGQGGITGGKGFIGK